jgi:pimeloyl-ACP methyl ester carboxylesterase
VNTPIDIDIDVPSDVPRSFYFGPETRPLFGVLHPPDAANKASHAVLMLGPWGAEDMSAHRSLRTLAQSIAQHGYPCMRFDYDGCGDSYDPLPDDNLWALWHESTAAAIDTLKYLTGVDSVVLLGMRLGALLAAEIAAERPDVAALVLMAPVRSGQAYLKELRMLGGAMAQGDTQGKHAMFAAGFTLNHATVQAIQGSTLPEALMTPCVAVIDRADMGVGRRWIDSLAVQGLHTFYCAEPGYPELVLTAHKAKPALHMFGKVLEVLQLFSAAIMRKHTVPIRHTIQPRLNAHVLADGYNVIEKVLPPFGSMGMAAIWVGPGAGVTFSGRGLLILNSSAERRIGPNRMWVGFARARAALGDVVIRLDMPGLGESLQDYHNEPNLVYPRDAVKHVAAFLKAQLHALNSPRWAVMGLCSGAYHSYRLALAQRGVYHVFSINTFGFLPKDVQDLDVWNHSALQFAVAKNATRNLAKPDRWLKLLRGQVNLRVLTRSIWGRIQKVTAKNYLKIGRWLKLIEPPELAREFRVLNKHGCRVHFIFSTRDPGPAMLREALAFDSPTLFNKGPVTEDQIANADHTFAGLAGRAALFVHLHRRLDAWEIAHVKRIRAPKMTSEPLWYDGPPSEPMSLFASEFLPPHL